MSTKYDLPNSMVQEVLKLQELLLKVRSSSGQLSFTSSSSGVTYLTTGSAYDNMGETGLLSLIKIALGSYQIVATDWNTLYSDMQTTLANMKQHASDISDIIGLGGLI